MLAFRNCSTFSAKSQGSRTTPVHRVRSVPYSRGYAKREVPPGVKVKETTGLVGLDVNPFWREDLMELYDRILHEIKAVPEKAGYRVAVERLYNHRLKIVSSTNDYEDVEEQFYNTQVEQLLEHARDELELIPIMLEAKPWETDPEVYEPGILVVQTIDDPFTAYDLNPGQPEEMRVGSAQGKAA
eukprot:TRINITY_DN1182_c0_g1_i1.p1 TRINITY_DN1182_c0_g1~~TRINITY_DN1182_c0_g1_i1.p1  ORF type:complete len:185 (-),score=39.67 TRINITY_DN1182_c0_g1_i1:40-594(-)